jgi:exosome complex exonuclease RRP6
MTSKGVLGQVIHHASHLAKPQLSFKHKPDNSDTPWYPTLSHKYNAKVPLGHLYTDAGEDVNIEGSSTLVYVLLNTCKYRCLTYLGIPAPTIHTATK